MKKLIFILMMVCLGNIFLFAQTQKRIMFCQKPGMMHGPQIGLQEALKGKGYAVDTTYTPFDFESLSGYDLVIVSRATSSGQFMDAMPWNSLDVPVMVLNSWCVRDGRLRLINAELIATENGGLVDRNLVTNAIPVANADGTYDPIFNGVTTSGAAFPYVKWFYDYLDYHISDFTADLNTGKPLVILAGDAGAGAGAVMMARWEPGTEAYPGTGIHANYRTYMNIGADENTQKVFNMDSYTDASLKLFLNEVAYLISQQSGCHNPAIIAQPQNINLNVGTSATYSVTATGTNLTYQWKKGGANILGATSSSYTISSVVLGDVGDYTVVVSGACGSPVTSNVAKLATLVKPDGGVVIIHIIGDSTAASEPSSIFPLIGWGQVLGNFLDPTKFQVDNAAISGESSKSFYDSFWMPVYKTLNPGDFVLIQFGHNDAKPEAYRHTEPYTTYKDYLKLYIAGSKAKGAIPVLCTPIPRNVWSGNEVTNSHGDYPDAVKQTATEMDVPFLDLGNKTKIMMESMGKDSMNTIFMILKPGQYPNWPDGDTDNTHLQENGAIKVAKLAIEGLQELELVTNSPSLEIENGDFRVYPNPVRNILNISSIKGDVKEISLKLYDIRGIELYGHTETGDCKLDISKYQSGIYFLQIICEGKADIRKIIKH